MLAQDVVWNTIGGETMHGADAVANSMSGLAGLEFDISLHDVVANDDHVVGLVEVHVTAGDKDIRYRTAEIHHVNAEGKVTNGGPSPTTLRPSPTSSLQSAKESSAIGQPYPARMGAHMCRYGRVDGVFGIPLRHWWSVRFR
jgi:hypothetical protein